MVTSPSHLSKELGRHLTDGYCLLSLSGEFRVPRSIDFRVSVIGDLFVEHGVCICLMKECIHFFRCDLFGSVLLTPASFYLPRQT